jgi:hypothetical protein
VFTLSETGATSEAARCLADRENAGEVGGIDLGAQERRSPPSWSISPRTPPWKPAIWRPHGC